MISQQKIKERVDLYLSHIEKITPEVHVREKEGYKFKSVETFQQNFSIETVDLAAMLDMAIINNNLVAGLYHFPRKMLIIFAREYPDETRKILRDLFNEQISVSERLNTADMAFNKLMANRNKHLDEELHSFIGLRFLSLLLSYCYPNAHNALKPREWKAFCRFIDDEFSMPHGISIGQQYEIFTPYKWRGKRR